jgi:hypothetical protein
MVRRKRITVPDILLTELFLPLVDLLDDGVVAQFSLLCDDEQGGHLDLGRGVHAAIADVAGQVRTRVTVSVLLVGLSKPLPGSESPLSVGVRIF